ncbi:protein phosphatase 2C domain-containing protein [uncultured Thiohalocapsa sp.]|uniref:PP2C family protein-serine/threonine phosphatase n=1 Tax=uncultured Thiohalocapsa sp. TaxID=768990 RepID=UPI0025E775AF|nr:protein phosphatase 2C domain-containing protein [uncultured Thiohalocapsa sp.]
MSRLAFTTARISHAGGREYNEDCCAYRGACWVLADGLGGHGGGEVASRLAVQSVLGTLADTPPLAGSIEQAVQAANRALHAEQQKSPALERMRTTLVILVSDGSAARWGHVGDSRLYYFRGGRLAAQTEDHSVPQAMVKAGEIRAADIRHHEDRNRLLRTLGNDEEPRPTLVPAPVPLAPGDAFLLCTDGFWEYVTETQMEIELAKAADPDTWLRNMTRRLVKQAEPEHDNYTALAVFVH